MTDTPAAAPYSYISYAQFGERFFVEAVTQQRVEAVVATLSGRPIEVGPLGVGPLGLIKVRVTGEVGTASVTPRKDELVSFAIALPAQLALKIDIGLDQYRFAGDLLVRTPVTARAAEPLRIVIDIEAPSRRSIDVHLAAEGLRASVLQVFGVVESEIKRAVATYVRRELDKPEIRDSLVIDVSAALDRIKLPGGADPDPAD